jgi:hypothetical protein
MAPTRCEPGGRDASNHRQQWRPPLPRDLPELRGKLATWLAEWGAEFYCVMALSGSQQVFPDAPDRITGAVRLAAQERQRVVDAELYWVSEEMTELAVHAGRQLTRFELYEHDLPSPTGFIMFAEPIAAWTQHGVTVEIVAASWGL